MLKKLPDPTPATVTVTVDGQPQPGGQIYRGVGRVGATGAGHLPVLGDDYAAGLTVVRRFRAAGVDYRPQTAVWQIGRDLTVRYRGAGGVQSLKAPQVLIA